MTADKQSSIRGKGGTLQFCRSPNVYVTVLVVRTPENPMPASRAISARVQDYRPWTIGSLLEALQVLVSASSPKDHRLQNEKTFMVVRAREGLVEIPKINGSINWLRRVDGH